MLSARDRNCAFRDPAPLRVRLMGAGGGAQMEEQLQKGVDQGGLIKSDKQVRPQPVPPSDTCGSAPGGTSGT